MPEDAGRLNRGEKEAQKLGPAEQEFSIGARERHQPPNDIAPSTTVPSP